MLLRLMLQEVAPADRETPSQELGQYAGIETGVLRLQAGVMRELLNLIGRNQAAIEHETFRKVLAKLSREAREAWRALTAVAFGKTASTPLAKALMFIRNKVGFHYDPKEIARCYREFFAQSDQGGPLLSRGQTMGQTRFYFADAAAQAYMKEKGGLGDAESHLIGKEDGGDFLDHANSALHQIVTRFPAQRGYGWREWRT